MRAVKGKAELAFSFPRIYLHLFFCVFIPRAQHNRESLFVCIPLVAPLRGLPALALLALLVAHHVEVPLLAISVAATTNKKSTCDASFVRRPGAVVENVLEILLDPFRLGCGCLVHTFPPHTYFAWEEEKERCEVVGTDAQPPSGQAHSPATHWAPPVHPPAQSNWIVRPPRCCCSSLRWRRSRGHTG